MPADAKYYISNIDYLKKSKGNFNQLARDVAEYCLPHRQILRNTTPGTKHNLTLYDNTGTRAAFMLAAVMHASLTGQSSDWFNLSSDLNINGNISPSSDVQLYLDNAELITKRNLQLTNYYSVAFENFLDAVVFGTTAKLIEEVYDSNKNKMMLNFRCIPFEQFYIDENVNGSFDVLYREYKETARRIVQKYPHIAPKLKNIDKDQPNKEFTIIHAVEPASSSNKAFNSRHKFVSAVILMEEEVQLNGVDNGTNKGFYEFPYEVFRWKRMPGEVYGRSPAMDVLPTMRMLNKTLELSLLSAELDIRPSGLFRSGNFTDNTFSLLPGVNIPCRDPEAYKQLTSGGRHEVAQLVIRDMQSIIKEGFFVDQVSFPPLEQQGTPATATEISTRVAFSNRILAPIFGRYTHEAAMPGMERIINIQDRMGLLGDPPPEIVENGFSINFTGQLARNQRFEEAAAIDETLMIFSQFAPEDEIRAEMSDAMRIGDMAVERSRIRGLKERFFKTEDERQQLKEARQQQQEAQFMSEMVNKGADSMAKAGKVNAG